MAKQLVSPIERHVDKAVLAITALVLIGVIGKFSISSPNKIELGSVRVSPAGIGQKVLDNAESVRSAVTTSRPPDMDVERRLDEFVKGLDAFDRKKVALDLPGSAPFGPDVPLVGNIVVTGWIDLLDVGQMERPIVSNGRSTVSMNDEEPEPGEVFVGGTPVNWAIITGVWERAELLARQMNDYGTAKKKVYAWSVDVERRAMRPDGTFADEDWAHVQPLASVSFPRPEEVELTVIEDEAGPGILRSQMSDLAKFIDRLEFPDLQLDFLRPLMPIIVNGTPWNMPLITTRIDVLRMDDEYLFPDEPPTPTPEDSRYPDSPNARRDDTTAAAPSGGGGGTAAAAAGDKFKRHIAEAKKKYAAAEQEWAVETALAAYNAAMDAFNTGGITARQKEEAVAMREKATQLESDIRRDPYKNRQRPGATAGAGAEGKEEGPVRVLEPRQQVWVHDGQPGSLEGGQTFQYRIRMTIYNELAGEPGFFKDPKNAEVLFIAGQWSEPSDSVYIEPDQAFFVTNESKTRGNVGVEFYRWFDGVWVKNKSLMKFKLGEPMTGAVRHPVPLYGGGVDRPNVNYSAGGLVLDLDFDRRVRFRKTNRNNPGVRFDKPSADTAVVIMDDSGRVFERVVSVDKQNPDKNLLRRREWSPPRTVR